MRSYRRVFRVDRRIYRVDRWALPVPGGVPLRGLAYFALALLAVLVVQGVPVVGGLIVMVSAPLRYRVCRAYPAEDYVDEAWHMLDARRQDPEAWRELLASHQSHLRRLRSFVPEVYLAVSLMPSSRGTFGTAVFIKALYSLVLAVVVAVAAALAQAAGELGFLFAFGLQAVFYWALFLYRRQITQRLVAATSGGRGYDDQPVRALAQRGADVAAHPIGALAGFSWRQVKGSLRQESALSHSTEPTAPARAPGNGDDPPPPAWPSGPTGDRPPRSPRPSGTPANGSGPDTGQSGGTAAPAHLNGHARSQHPPAFNGQGAAATPPQPAPRARPGGERSPRAPELGQSPGAPAEEDVMRRARELREHDDQALRDPNEEQLP